LSITIYDPDVNADLTVDCTDVSILATNFGKTSGATFAQGDTNGDGRVDVVDLNLVQNSLVLDACGVRMSPGGGGGGESMMGGGGESMMGGEFGGGGESFTGTPARFYFTTSGSTSGGGQLGATVPEITLPEPGETVDLYIWVKMEDHEALRGYAIDVFATTAGVVKAVQSEIYRPYILDTQSQEEVDLRWTLERAAVLNRNGVGGTELVYDAAAANVIGGLDLRDGYDGTGWYTDPLYDAASDAFLVQRVRLEGLPGSAGQSTNLKMRIGRLGMLIDNSSIASPLPIDFGLGTTDVLNTDIFGTDGTTHATVAVAAGSPGAVISSVAAPNVRRTVSMRTQVEPRISSQMIVSAQPPTTEPQSSTRPIASLRAVRRAVDGRALDRLLTF
jgi:hypothetical protein